MIIPSLPDRSFLEDAGLNRQYVFDVSVLPAEILAPLNVAAHETQIVLFAHAGKRLWDRVQAQRGHEEHPIDEYSVRTVKKWMSLAIPQARARFVFPIGLPAGQHIGLQSLGQLAGWHHPSPFMIGIDARWGSWFAYRAVVLADTSLPTSIPDDSGNPCDECTVKSCITACVGNALGSGAMDFQACQSERLTEHSPCARGCNARQSCPIGAEHKYETSQIEHGSAQSLNAIRRYYKLAKSRED